MASVTKIRGSRQQFEISIGIQKNNLVGPFSYHFTTLLNQRTYLGGGSLVRSGAAVFDFAERVRSGASNCGKKRACERNQKKQKKMQNMRKTQELLRWNQTGHTKHQCSNFQVDGSAERKDGPEGDDFCIYH